jgi:hypothetical protein
MSMNYAQLTQAIQDYMENSEATFVSQIPTFVRQTEERVFRTVLLPELRTHATTNAVAGNPYLARPTDFLAPFSMAVVTDAGEYYYLQEKDTDFVRQAYTSPSSTGLPRYYAQFDGDRTGSEGNFVLGPTPDAAYTVALHYYYDPESIVTAGTSWLGNNAEMVLLYGSLTEAYTFMKGDADMMQQYEKKYQEALQGLGGLARLSMTDNYRKDA